jgi:hypothetical protein
LGDELGNGDVGLIAGLASGEGVDDAGTTGEEDGVGSTPAELVFVAD